MFRITEFDDSASGLYVCKVKVGGEEVEGYVRAQIYGIPFYN